MPREISPGYHSGIAVFACTIFQHEGEAPGCAYSRNCWWGEGEGNTFADLRKPLVQVLLDGFVLFSGALRSAHSLRVIQ